MRVGLVIYGALETLSGGYLYDRQLVQTLRAAGDTVEVVSLPWRNYPSHLFDNWRADVFARLAGLQVDVLLQDELNHPSLVWLNPRLRATLNCPIVTIVHHLRSSEDWPLPQRKFYRWVERQYLNSVDGFIFNSHTTRQVVEQAVGNHRPAVVAQPAGDRFGPRMTPEQACERAHSPGPLRVVFVGNIIPRKSLLTLLGGMAHLPSDTIELTVIGRADVDPHYTRQVQAFIAQRKLGQQVRWLGPLGDAALADHLARAHALVVPSSYEGFGIVYLEGMGFGLPAIGSTVGAAGEIIANGQNGWLVAPGDWVGLAAHLQHWHEDRTLLAEMSKQALARYAKHPNWETSMAHAHQFLRGLC